MEAILLLIWVGIFSLLYMLYLSHKKRVVLRKLIDAEQRALLRNQDRIQRMRKVFLELENRRPGSHRLLLKAGTLNSNIIEHNARRERLLARCNDLARLFLTDKHLREFS